MSTAITVIDVRTRAEFAGGHVAGSHNIPFLEIESHLDEIRRMRGTIELCCASGARSAAACNVLRNAGVECVNGGSWGDVNFHYGLTH